MTSFLKAADLTQDAFLNLVENPHLDADASTCYIWIEAPDGWALDHWNRQFGINGEIHWYRAGNEAAKESSRDCLTKSTAGRLFAKDGELRWRTIPALGDACWRVVFLGNVDWVGEALEDHSDYLNNLHPRQDSFYLWGQQTKATLNEWIELRIPHRFQYPINGNPSRVKVMIEQWSDETGEPHFVRLCNLEPIKGDK